MLSPTTSEPPPPQAALIFPTAAINPRRIPTRACSDIIFLQEWPRDLLRKLRSLSAHCGVATSYTDYRGSHVDVGDETLENTLHALGLSFSHDDTGIDAASEYFYTKEATRSLPPPLLSESRARMSPSPFTLSTANPWTSG